MLNVSHYESSEFLAIATVKNLKIFSHVIVLDCGIAGLIYMCKDNQNLYYLDCLFSSKLNQNDLLSKNQYEIHSEIYQKINLDKELRKNHLIK